MNVLEKNMNSYKDLIASLHNHSTYSMLDGASSPTEHVQYAIERGFKYLAITDHGHISGFMEFARACENTSLQPVFGCEFYVDLMPDLDTYGHLTVLAKNDQGYQNLLTLYHKSWDNLSKAKFGKKKNQITWDLLEEYNEGLFIGSGCLVGTIARCLLKNREDLAVKNLEHLIAIFGKNRMFAEFIPHLVSYNYNNKTQQFEKNECTPWCPDGDILKGYQLWLWDQAVVKRKLKPCITLDAHFTTPDKKDIQDALLMNGESGWRFYENYNVLKPEIVYNNLIYLPGHNVSLHESMIENVNDFCSDIKYTKKEKSIYLPYSYSSKEESYADFYNNVDINRLNKIINKK